MNTFKTYCEGVAFIHRPYTRWDDFIPQEVIHNDNKLKVVIGTRLGKDIFETQKRTRDGWIVVQYATTEEEALSPAERPIPYTPEDLENHAKRQPWFNRRVQNIRREHNEQLTNESTSFLYKFEWEDGRKDYTYAASEKQAIRLIADRLNISQRRVYDALRTHGSLRIDVVKQKESTPPKPKPKQPGEQQLTFKSFFDEKHPS